MTFPLLHANLDHLLSNTLPLIIFGFLVFLSGMRVFLTALACSWLGSGLAVWLIGGGGITVGASGLVFGLFAFLLVRGFFNRNWWQILLSVVLFMAYGGILFGHHSDRGGLSSRGRHTWAGPPAASWRAARAAGRSAARGANGPDAYQRRTPALPATGKAGVVR